MMEKLMTIHGEEYIFPGHDAPLPDPASVAFASTVKSDTQEAEDEDEWEYEYSTKQTEVQLAQFFAKTLLILYRHFM
jgi:hypothetical protein